MLGRQIKANLAWVEGLENVMAGQNMEQEIQARMWEILNVSLSISQGNLEFILSMVSRESLNFDWNYKLESSIWHVPCHLLTEHITTPGWLRVTAEISAQTVLRRECWPNACSSPEEIWPLADRTPCSVNPWIERRWVVYFEIRDVGLCFLFSQVYPTLKGFIRGWTLAH